MKADTVVAVNFTAGELVTLVSLCLGEVESTPQEQIAILKVGQRVAYALGNAAGTEVVALAEPELPLPAPAGKKRGRKPGGHNKPKPPPAAAVQTEIPEAAPAAGGAK